MSQPGTISHYVQARFHEAFGPPQNTMGHDYHWLFRATPESLPINLLLNGTRDDAAIWIFDARQHDDGVSHQSVTHRGQVDEIIKQIQDRVQRASKTA